MSYALYFQNQHNLEMQLLIVCFSLLRLRKTFPANENMLKNMNVLSYTCFQIEKIRVKCGPKINIPTLWAPAATELQFLKIVNQNCSFLAIQETNKIVSAIFFSFLLIHSWKTCFITLKIIAIKMNDSLLAKMQTPLCSTAS